MRSSTLPDQAPVQSLPLSPQEWVIERVPQIDSTSSELLRRAKAGHFNSTVLVAQTQTAGRGRQGRTWISEPEQALTFSLGFLFQPNDWMGLSLAIGVALVKALDPEGDLQLGLKWPNDVWYTGAQGPAKLAGILIETVNTTCTTAQALRYCVLGVGLNRRTPHSSVLFGSFPPPIGLLELGCSQSEGVLLKPILAELTHALGLFQAQGFKPFRADFDRLDALKHQEITLNAIPAGVALGVSESGELQVQTDGGVQHIVSQEVSVRPTVLLP